MYALCVFHHVEDQYYYSHIPIYDVQLNDEIQEQSSHIPFVQWLFEHNIVQWEYLELIELGYIVA